MLGSPNHQNCVNEAVQVKNHNIHFNGESTEIISKLSKVYWYTSMFFLPFFSLPGRSPGRAIVLPPASAAALASASAKC